MLNYRLKTNEFITIERRIVCGFEQELKVARGGNRTRSQVLDLDRPVFKNN